MSTPFFSSPATPEAASVQPPGRPSTAEPPQDARLQRVRQAVLADALRFRALPDADAALIEEYCVRGWERADLREHLAECARALDALKQAHAPLEAQVRAAQTQLQGQADELARLREAAQAAEAARSQAEAACETLQRQQQAWVALRRALIDEPWQDCPAVSRLWTRVCAALDPPPGEVEPALLQGVLMLAAWRAALGGEADEGLRLPGEEVVEWLELLGRSLARAFASTAEAFEQLPLVARTLEALPVLQRLEIRLEVPKCGAAVDNTWMVHRQAGATVRQVVKWALFLQGRCHSRAEVL